MDQKVLADLGGTERWDRHLEARRNRAGFLEEVGLLAGLGGVRKEGLGPQLCMDKDMKIDVSPWFRGWDFALVTFCLPALALALSLAGHADPDLCL